MLIIKIDCLTNDICTFAAHDVSDHQAWLLKTAAIELRMISLNQQRSHTQRLVRLLLGDEDQDMNSKSGIDKFRSR